MTVRAPMPSLKRGLAFSAATLGLNIIFPLATFAYAARVLGPAALGRVNFAFALAAILLLLASLALPLYGAKAIAQVRDNRRQLDTTFSELLILNVAASLIGAAVFALLIAAVPVLRAETPLFLIAGASLPLLCFQVDWLFTGLEDFRALFIRGVAIKAATLALLLLLVHDSGDLLAFAAINVGAGGAANLWGLIASRKVARLRISGLAPLRHLRPLTAMSVTSIASGAYLQIDNLLLGTLAGPHSVGLYAAAIKIPRLAAIFLVSLGASTLPRAAYHAGAGAAGPTPEATLAFRVKSLQLLLFLCLPVMALCLALAPSIVLTLSGPAFAEASGAFRLGTFLILPAVLANFVAMQILIPAGKEKAMMIGVVAGAVANVGLNLAAIPRWGIVGSAGAAVATEALVMAFMFGSARGKGMPVGILRSAGLRYLAAAAAAGGLAAAAGGWLDARGLGHWISMALALAAGTAGYAGLMWGFGGAAAREFIRYPVAALARRL